MSGKIKHPFAGSATCRRQDPTTSGRFLIDENLASWKGGRDSLPPAELEAKAGRDAFLFALVVINLSS
jgi:hypothetical protein